MPTNLSSATPNRLLSRRSAADFALLSPHLKRVDLPVRKKLEIRDKSIDKVYFPESGFASVVANGSGQRSIEVGLIGLTAIKADKVWSAAHAVNWSSAVITLIPQRTVNRLEEEHEIAVLSHNQE